MIHGLHALNSIHCGPASLRSVLTAKAFSGPSEACHCWNVLFRILHSTHTNDWTVRMKSASANLQDHASWPRGHRRRDRLQPVVPNCSASWLANSRQEISESEIIDRMPLKRTPGRRGGRGFEPCPARSLILCSVDSQCNRACLMSALVIAQILRKRLAMTDCQAKNDSSFCRGCIVTQM